MLVIAQCSWLKHSTSDANYGIPSDHLEGFYYRMLGAGGRKRPQEEDVEPTTGKKPRIELVEQDPLTNLFPNLKLRTLPKTIRGTLLERIARTRLGLQHIEGDGNCQFRSVSKVLKGTQEHYKTARAKVVKEMTKNPQVYMDYGTSLNVPGWRMWDRSYYDNYVRKMVKDREWGDFITLFAAANVWHVRVILYCSYKNDAVKEFVPINRRIYKDVYLAYTYYSSDAAHYEVLMPPEDVLALEPTLTPERTPRKLVHVQYRVIVKNISYGATSDHLRDLFSNFGRVVDARVIYTREGYSRGFGFVVVEDEQMMDAAINALNGMLWQQREIEVIKAMENYHDLEADAGDSIDEQDTGINDKEIDDAYFDEFCGVNSSHPNTQSTMNQNPSQDFNSQNIVNDPLHIASLDHPGMMLTTTSFNGSNFLGWSRTIKMALGVKLKFRFIDDTSPKPAVIDGDYQRWIRCDYMVTCWILNSMIAELSESLLYAQSARDLWKELEERHGCWYPDWYKGKKNKKGKMAAQVATNFSPYMTKETPFDFEYENNVQTGSTDLDQRMVATVYQEMMKMFKGQGLDPSNIASTSQAHAGTYYIRCKPYRVFSFHVTLNVLAKNLQLDLRVDWIVDTGASDHMSPHLHLFHSLRVLKKPIKIRLPDGTSKWVEKVGHIRINNLLTLHNVFYVPDFKDPSTKKVLAVGQATYLINKEILGWKTPFEMLHGKAASYEQLRVMGCLCFVTVTKPHKDKFSPRSIKSVLISYSPGQKGYKLYNLETYEVFYSKDVIFHETDFPFKQGSLVNTSSPIAQWPNEIGSQDDDLIPCSVPNTIPEPVVPNTPKIEGASSESPAHEQQSSIPTTTMPNLVPTTRKSTRSSSQPVWLKDFVTTNHKAGMATSDNFNPKHSIYPLFQREDFAHYPADYVTFLANVLAIKEPLFYSQTVTDPNWVKAMNKELQALETNDTWTLIKLPSGS
ncbi:retrovirus-related pol polyprotein from transposon TNT 1-94 [Tanacetum coccineum]